MANTSTNALEDIQAWQILEGFRMPLNERKRYFSAYRTYDPLTIRFTGQNIHGDLEISGIEPGSEYQFVDCIFNGNLIFSDQTDVRFSFENCELGFVEFRKGKYDASIAFAFCKVSYFKISSGEFHELDLNIHDGVLVLTGGRFDNFMLHGRSGECVMERLTFLLPQLSGYLHIGTCYTSDLHLCGNISPELTLRIDHCFSHHVLIDNVYNSGKLTLDFITANPGFDLQKNVHPIAFKGDYTEEQKRLAEPEYQKSFFCIKNSNLKDAELNQVDLSSYHEVNFFRSKLSEVSISNMKWPDKIIAIAPPGSEEYVGRMQKNFRLTTEENLEERENYRQLKYTCSKHQDYIGEQHFHGLEMRAYYKSLDLWKKGGTKAIIKLSYLTSNFGQSIARPLLGIAIVNGLLFYLLYLTGKGPFHGYDLTRLENYFNTLAEFVRYTNPLHNIDEKIKGIPFLIDVLMRICSSYFIYNLIRATRRFVR